MILSPALLALIADLYARERAAAVAYDALGLWADAAGFDGTAARFLADAREEEGHARTWVDLLRRRSAAPPLACASPPDALPDALPGAYAAALDLERTVTAALSALADTALAEGDHALYAVAQGFLAGQERAEYELETATRQLADLDAAGWRLWDAEQGEG